MNVLTQSRVFKTLLLSNTSYLHGEEGRVEKGEEESEGTEVFLGSINYTYYKLWFAALHHTGEEKGRCWQLYLQTRAIIMFIMRQRHT